MSEADASNVCSSVFAFRAARASLAAPGCKAATSGRQQVTAGSPLKSKELHSLLLLRQLRSPWLCLTAKLRQAARSAMPLVETIAAKTKRPAVSRAAGLKLVTAQIMNMIKIMADMKNGYHFGSGDAQT